MKNAEWWSAAATIVLASCHAEWRYVQTFNAAATWLQKLRNCTIFNRCWIMHRRHWCRLFYEDGLKIPTSFLVSFVIILTHKSSVVLSCNNRTLQNVTKFGNICSSLKLSAQVCETNSPTHYSTSYWLLLRIKHFD